MNNLFDISVKLDELTEGQYVHSGVLQIVSNEHIGGRTNSREIASKSKR